MNKYTLLMFTMNERNLSRSLLKELILEQKQEFAEMTDTITIDNKTIHVRPVYQWVCS